MPDSDVSDDGDFGNNWPVAGPERSTGRVDGVELASGQSSILPMTRTPNGKTGDLARRVGGLPHRENISTLT